MGTRAGVISLGRAKELAGEGNGREGHYITCKIGELPLCEGV